MLLLLLMVRQRVVWLRLVVLVLLLVVRQRVGIRRDLRLIARLGRRWRRVGASRGRRPRRGGRRGRAGTCERHGRGYDGRLRASRSLGSVEVEERLRLQHLGRELRVSVLLLRWQDAELRARRAAAGMLDAALAKVLFWPSRVGR